MNPKIPSRFVDDFSSFILLEDKTVERWILGASDDIILRGGEGSGNFGHAGREGEVGGSSSSSMGDLSSLSEKQKSVVKEYTGAGTGVNGFLRGFIKESGPGYGSYEKWMYDEAKQKADIMVSAFDAMPPLENDITVYRGTTYKPLFEGLKDGSIKTGAIISDAGVLSTSTKPEIAALFKTHLQDKSDHGYQVFMTINVTKGTKIISVEGSGIKGEYEVILKNSSLLKITSVNILDTHIEITTEVMP